jgi:secretion/DNA translocation related TadE-like protein
MSGRPTTRNERGNVAVLMLAAMVVAGSLCLAVAGLGGAAVERARADVAADAAALAAADALALGRSSAAAAGAARQVAAENGAALVSCECAGRSAVVIVGQGDARGRARAVVDP